MITVWGRENSTNVKKVLWCLEELGLDHQRIPAGGQYGLNRDPQYLAMNPNGLVPCLRDDETGLILWESHSIVRYLAAQYGQSTLWQVEPAARAVGEKWMDWTIGALTEPYRGVFISLVRTPPAQRDSALIERSIAECDALFSIVDGALAGQPWLSGEHFGLGDIAFGPVAYALLNLDIAWTEHPHLQDWYQRVSARPAFAKTVAIPLS